VIIITEESDLFHFMVVIEWIVLYCNEINVQSIKTKSMKVKYLKKIIATVLIYSFHLAANAQEIKYWWNNNCRIVHPITTSVRQLDTFVNNDSVIIVPTVFHILTQGQSENISKSHVQKVLEILNRDFNRQNPDTFDIPVPFHPFRGNPKIEFRLARIDPNGNCTDGIDRVYVPLAGIYGNLYDNYGWDHRRYMNIYIVKWIENDPLRTALGYLASIDTGYVHPDNYDFVEMPYINLVDGLGNTTAIQRSHLLSHELGHNLGLNHIWGWLAGCTDDDDVADTPLQDDANGGYPVFPHITCNNGPDGDMFNNFMDYSEPVNMFSVGQADRMRTCLARNEWRDSIWLSANLAATGVEPVLPPCQNAPTADFGYGNYSGWLCAGSPIQFYQAASVNANSYYWEFTGGNPATSTDTFPSVIFPDSGMHNVRLIVNNSFGIDTADKLIRIEPAEVYYTINNNSITESFEDTIFNKQIPQWLVLGKKWSVTNLAAVSGNRSIRMDSTLQFFNTFFTHIFDLNQITGTGRTLEFKVACGLSAAGTIAGGLRVTWKRPCEYEWADLIGRGAFHPGDALLPDSLQTAITNSVFIPNSSQWKTITLDIPDSLTGEIQIGFNWGSFIPTNKLKGLYIDDIKVNGPVGISENNSAISWNLFPNPATEYLSVTLRSNHEKVTLTITDIFGKIIYSLPAIKEPKVEVNIKDFAAGVYVVRIQSSDLLLTKKVIVAK
jgi:PKD repeat protein